MYQALYRKWRPRTFDDVAGQEHITTTLKNELKNGRVSHAYLFTGSRGTGKTTCAKILAKTVNCLNPQNGNPCCECEICRGIDEESVTDVVEMDAASNRGIEDIRTLIEKAQFSPTRAKYRVYIIDEVHSLSNDAFNSLLKTLEEPPEHVIFVLATTEINKVLGTIRSRCQQFDFHRIPVRAIADRLLYVADREQLNLTDEAAVLIASISDGALRDALSLLDRCVSVSRDVDGDVVRAAAGLADKDYLFNLASCAINKNTAGALDLIDRLYGEAKDMPKLCDELIAHFRALMLIKTVNNPREMTVFTDDEFDRAVTQADYLSLAEIIYYMDVLSRAYARMGSGSGDRTELEMAVVKLSSPELDVTNEALFARISALEKALKKGIALGSVPAEKPVEVTEEKPSAAQPQEASKPAEEAPSKNDAAPEKPKSPVVTQAPPPVRPNARQDEIDVVALSKSAKPFARWPEIVESLKSISSSISAAFAGSLAYENDGFLLIDANNSLAFDLLKLGDRRKEVRDALREQTGKNYRLGPYRLKAEDEEKNDPLDEFKSKLRDSGIQIHEE